MRSSEPCSVAFVFILLPLDGHHCSPCLLILQGFVLQRSDFSSCFGLANPWTEHCLSALQYNTNVLGLLRERRKLWESYD